MEPESLKHNQHLQMNLDKLRAQEGYDFGGIALYDYHHTSSPIKWQYVSGNTNDRYKLIILRKGRGLAGMVMKTGKRMVIADVDTALSPEEKVKFPIILSESLTAVREGDYYEKSHIAFSSISYKCCISFGMWERTHKNL